MLGAAQRNLVNKPRPLRDAIALGASYRRYTRSRLPFSAATGA